MEKQRLLLVATRSVRCRSQGNQDDLFSSGITKIRTMAQNKLLVLFALSVILSFPGCGTVKTEPVASPVEISGKVTMSQGSIPEGVKITFQPTQSGYGESFVLQGDGSFKGSMIPGPYMYFFTADESAEGAAALQAVPKPLQEPDLNRKVEVTSGQPVTITVP